MTTQFVRPRSSRNASARIRIASGLLLALRVPATNAGIPVAFASLFSFDAPRSMSTLSAWGMFLIMVACPLLAVGAGAVSLANLAAGSARMLIIALTLMVLPATIMLLLSSRIYGAAGTASPLS